MGTKFHFFREFLSLNYEFTDISFGIMSFKEMEIFNLFLYRTNYSCSGIKIYLKGYSTSFFLKKRKSKIDFIYTS